MTEKGSPLTATEIVARQLEFEIKLHESALRIFIPFVEHVANTLAECLKSSGTPFSGETLDDRNH